MLKSGRKVLLPHQKLSEGLINTPELNKSAVKVAEVDGRSGQCTTTRQIFLLMLGSGRKVPLPHQKLPEGLIDAPEVDESAILAQEVDRRGHRCTGN